MQAYYEAANNGPVNVVPLATYVSDLRCPYPKPTGGDMTLPSWLYNSQTGKCYYKSSFAKGISGNIDDARRRCRVSHVGECMGGFRYVVLSLLRVLPTAVTAVCWGLASYADV